MRNYLLVIMLLFFVVAKATAQELRDPTTPTHVNDVSNISEMDSHGLELNAIFYTTDNHTAVINGRVLREGEKVGDYTVSAIKEDAVTLKSNNGDSVVLQFSDIKKEPQP